ncbi:MAG: metal ABC transporter ATP-binding protein [Phycisphaerae bacterium]
MSAAVVEISDVTFGYPPDPGRNPVLQDIDLEILQDDFLGIVGPNGGGKTTLLKLMLGLLLPHKGRVRVLGAAPRSVRERIGYVPQHAQVDPTVPADVLDVVLMGRLGRSPWGPRYSARDVRIARDALAQTGTETLARRPIGMLSGGQRQRVLIARALASDAELLLLDEPTAGVDVHMERGLFDLLRKLNETLPIVMISHDVSFVSSKLKRVACLNRTLACHAAHEVTDEMVASMYHGHVHAVEHGDHCAHAHEAEVPDS